VQQRRASIGGLQLGDGTWYGDGDLVEQCRAGDRSALSPADQFVDDIVNLRSVVEQEAQDELVGEAARRGRLSALISRRSRRSGSFCRCQDHWAVEARDRRRAPASARRRRALRPAGSSPSVVQTEFFGVGCHLVECRTAFRDYIVAKGKQIGEWYSAMGADLVCRQHAVVDQLHDRRPGYVQDLCRLLRGGLPW
jgi:hypothetical protein